MRTMELTREGRPGGRPSRFLPAAGCTPWRVARKPVPCAGMVAENAPPFS